MYLFRRRNDLVFRTLHTTLWIGKPWNFIKSFRSRSRFYFLASILRMLRSMCVSDSNREDEILRDAGVFTRLLARNRPRIQLRIMTDAFYLVLPLWEPTRLTILVFSSEGLWRPVYPRALAHAITKLSAYACVPNRPTTTRSRVRVRM